MSSLKQQLNSKLTKRPWLSASIFLLVLGVILAIILTPILLLQQNERINSNQSANDCGDDGECDEDEIGRTGSNDMADFTDPNTPGSGSGSPLNEDIGRISSYSKDTCQLVQIQFIFDDHPEDVSWMVTLGSLDDLLFGSELSLDDLGGTADDRDDNGDGDDNNVEDVVDSRNDRNDNARRRRSLFRPPQSNNANDKVNIAHDKGNQIIMDKDRAAIDRQWNGKRVADRSNVEGEDRSDGAGNEDRIGTGSGNGGGLGTSPYDLMDNDSAYKFYPDIPLIVALSHNQYQYMTHERHSFCLPGEGVYTFTIFDWGGDGLCSTSLNGVKDCGEYRLVWEDRIVFSSSGTGELDHLNGGHNGDYGYVSTHTFRLPLKPLPTPLSPTDPSFPSISPSISSAPQSPTPQPTGPTISPTISSAPTYSCTYIEVEIEFDAYPEETQWVIIRGGWTALDAGDFETIFEMSYSNGGEGSDYVGGGGDVGVGGVGSDIIGIGSGGGHEVVEGFSTVRERICIPNLPQDNENGGKNDNEGEGNDPIEYSFVILDKWYNGICCDYGQGSYTISYADTDIIIKQGGKFNGMDVASFFIPHVIAPSMSPSVSHVPTMSASPTVDCTYVTLQFMFDYFPSDTDWVMVKDAESGNAGAFEGDDGGANSVVVAQSPGYDDFQFGGMYVEQGFCLPGDGVYTFTITDASGDGMCCDYGQGGYALILDESSEIIATSDTSITNPNAGNSDNPDYSFSEQSTSFTIPYVPPAPTVSPKPSTSPAPTKLCIPLEISITFDSNPTETKWIVVEGPPETLLNDDDDHGVTLPSIIAESPSYNYKIPSNTEKENICLNGEGTYTVFMIDGGGDGMCCGFGNGEYVIKLDRGGLVGYDSSGNNSGGDGNWVVIAQGGEFQSLEYFSFDVPFVAPPSPSPINGSGASGSTGGNANSPANSNANTCYQLTVSLTFDAYPGEISWSIYSGNPETDIAIVIERSPTYDMSLADATVTHEVCLTEMGEYTFSIGDVGGDGLCCTFGEGSYTVTLLDEAGDEMIIAEGGEFGSTESISFFAPYGAEFFMPSAAPSQSFSPTTSMAPTQDCIYLDVLLKFDVFPYDVKWWVIMGEYEDWESNNQGFVAQSENYDVDRFTNVKEEVCLPSEGTYSFIIFDDSGNGLCCEYGEGSYQLASGKTNEIFAQGGEFGFFDIVTFEVPFVVPPSMQPSVSSAPSVSNVPTLDCIVLEVVITVDFYPSEISWEITQGETSSLNNTDAAIIASSPEGDAHDETHTICLPSNGVYTFTIFDSSGDGICCISGRGGYQIIVNGVSIAEGGEYGFEESVTFTAPYAPEPTERPSISSAPTITIAPTEDLECLTLSLQFDDYPEDTLWDIVIGEVSSLDSRDVTVVERSQHYGFEYASTIEEKNICLEDGRYTFTIMDYSENGLCCEYGEGGFILFQKGSPNLVIGKGSEFERSESVTFDIPFYPQPTPSPTESMKPTISMSPTPGCVILEISITFDSFPDETSWMVVYGDLSSMPDDSVILVESPPYDSTSEGTERHQVCLPSMGTYTFAIYDQSWDGMCCGFGEGGYLVTLLDDTGSVIAEGGQFEEYEATTFSIPFVTAPSMSPSLSVSPTVTSAPTIDCISIEVVITFDAFPSEIQWFLTEGDEKAMESNDYVVIAESPFYLDADYADSTLREPICLPEEGVYTFTIVDSSGDGICCAYGDGSFSIVSKDDEGKVVVEGGMFEFYQSHSFIVPFMDMPSMAPTKSPAPTISHSPTTSCIWVEVVLNFDATPSETLWELTIGNTTSLDDEDAIIVDESSIYSSNEYVWGTVTHTVCMPGNNVYTFTILDAGGDGMCCEFGTGGYILLNVSDDGTRRLVAQGGDFIWEESITFELPISIPPR